MDGVNLYSIGLLSLIHCGRKKARDELDLAVDDGWRNKGQVIDGEGGEIRGCTVGHWGCSHLIDIC